MRYAYIGLVALVAALVTWQSYRNGVDLDPNDSLKPKKRKEFATKK